MKGKEITPIEKDYFKALQRHIDEVNLRYINPTNVLIPPARGQILPSREIKKKAPYDWITEGF